MKSQDIVVLLKLVSLSAGDDESNPSAFPGEINHDDPLSVRGLATALGISKSEISASIKRSQEAGLVAKNQSPNRPRPSRRNLLEFLVHGVKFVFPAKVGALQRGIPTAFAAPALKDRLVSAGSSIHVWPYAQGSEMGQSVEPLFKSVPEAVLRDPRLYEYLALVDALRLGNQREAKLAEDMLSERIVKK